MQDSYHDDVNRLLPVHIWRLDLANLRDQAIQPLSDLLCRPKDRLYQSASH